MFFMLRPVTQNVQARRCSAIDSLESHNGAVAEIQALVPAEIQRFASNWLHDSIVRIGSTLLVRQFRQTD